MKEDGPVVVHPKICRLCGHCVAVCPTDSITHEKISIQDCPLIGQHELPSIDMMITAFRTRRSYRRYKDRPVPREMILDLISHSRWIPTGENRQFMDWIVLDDPKKMKHLLELSIPDIGFSLG
jgi:ferredoxin